MSAKLTTQDSRPTFNYTEAVREVCRDMFAKLPIFRGYDVAKIGFSLKRAKGSPEFGVLASMTPLRFENGSIATFRRGSYWKTPGALDFDKKTELLYIFTIYAPRFWERSLKEKIETITHELYHIGPDFDGDIRRFEGRKYAHGPSKKKFDAFAAKLADDWLATDPDVRLWNFLQYRKNELFERFKAVGGWKFPGVKLVKIDVDEAKRLNCGVLPK